MTKSIDIRRILTIDDPAIHALVAQSDEYLSALYPPESNHAEPIDALVAKGSAFFAGYVNGQLAACGAVKLMKDDVAYGEIKRVFVDPAQRSNGLASAMMQKLEAYLVGEEIMTSRLEAGPLQPEALRLYQKLGYVERGPFGAYTADPLSVFMEKRLPG